MSLSGKCTDLLMDFGEHSRYDELLKGGVPLKYIVRAGDLVCALSCGEHIAARVPHRSEVASVLELGVGSVGSEGDERG